MSRDTTILLPPVDFLEYRLDLLSFVERRQIDLVSGFVVRAVIAISFLFLCPSSRTLGPQQYIFFSINHNDSFDGNRKKNSDMSRRTLPMQMVLESSSDDDDGKFFVSITHVMNADDSDNKTKHHGSIQGYRILQRGRQTGRT
jgi:hypothetical protein